MEQAPYNSTVKIKKITKNIIVLVDTIEIMWIFVIEVCIFYKQSLHVLFSLINVQDVKNFPVFLVNGPMFYFRSYPTDGAETDS